MSMPERITVVRDPGIRARLSPEVVALGLVAILTIAIVVPSSMPPISLGRSVAQATPSPTVPASSALPEPRFDTASIKLLLEINRLIGQSEKPLRAALARNVLDSVEVRTQLSEIVLNIRVGLDAAVRLESRSDTRAVGKRVAAYYQELRQIADRSFSAALASVTVHRRVAQDMLTALARRTVIDEQLAELLAQSEQTPEPNVSPEATASPEPSASPRSAPTVAPSIPPSAALTPPPGSAEAIPGDVVVNGGFEKGVAPWEVQLRDTAAVATANVDQVQHRFGSASLRVDITTSSESRTGIAVVQSALKIHSGRYVVRLYARTDGARQVRVAVGNSAGWTYAERLFDIGSAWSVLQFEFSAITGDDSATVEVDLGRSNASVWLDEISVAPAP